MNEMPKSGATNWLRIGVGVFLVVTCLRVWIGPFPMTASAQAQIPDSGLQRKQLLDETKRTNQLLTAIKTTLEKRTLNVRVVGADNQRGKTKAPLRRP